MATSDTTEFRWLATVRMSGNSIARYRSKKIETVYLPLSLPKTLTLTNHQQLS